MLAVHAQHGKQNILMSKQCSVLFGDERTALK